MNASTCDRVVLLVRQKVGLAPEDDLPLDTPLLDDGLWLDSVMVLELLLELEAEFGVELNAAELQAAGAMASCAELARFIDAKRGDG
jgi:acyl carrier protein